MVRFVSFCSVSFHFVTFRFALFRFVLFCSVSFRFVPFRFILFCFASFHYIILNSNFLTRILSGFLSHFSRPSSVVKNRLELSHGSRFVHHFLPSVQHIGICARESFTQVSYPDLSFPTDTIDFSTDTIIAITTVLLLCRDELTNPCLTI